MKTVSIELPDDMAEWLESWKAFSPAMPHDLLPIEGKIIACVHEVMTADLDQDLRDEMAADETRDRTGARWTRLTSIGSGTTVLGPEDNIPF